MVRLLPVDALGRVRCRSRRPAGRERRSGDRIRGGRLSRSSPARSRRISAKGGKGSVTPELDASAGATSYNIYYARSSSVSKTERHEARGHRPAVPSYGPAALRPDALLLRGHGRERLRRERGVVLGHGCAAGQGPQARARARPCGPLPDGRQPRQHGLRAPRPHGRSRRVLDRPIRNDIRPLERGLRLGRGARLRLRQSRPERLDPPGRLTCP